MIKVEELFIAPTATVLETLRKLDETGQRILFIAPEGHLKAVITDGDIRKFFLRGGTPDQTVDHAANYHPLSVSVSERGKARSILQEHCIDALPILKRIEGNKTAKKRMEAYVYQLIGRWKDTRGTEYVFREDGSCCIAGKEGYFGGSGYEITVGDEPYPTKGEYSVVSVRGKTVTLRGLQSGRTIRLSYLGEPTDREESADNPEN